MILAPAQCAEPGNRPVGLPLRRARQAVHAPRLPGRYGRGQLRTNSSTSLNLAVARPTTVSAAP